MSDPQKDNPVLCSLPFTQLRNGPQMNYQPCCWARSVSVCGPQNTSPIDYFKSDVFSKLRRDMLLGEITPDLENICHLCLENERNIGSSTRTEYSHDWSVLKNFDSNGRMIDTDDRFIKLEINAYGNHCNLECYECQPDNSSRRIERIKKMDNMWSGLFPRFSFDDRDVKKSNSDQWNSLVADLIEHGKNIKSMVFCGGEPMSMVSHFDILDAMIETDQAKDIELVYVTNFTMFSLRKMKKYIDAFKWVHISWSVDGLGDRNYWLRYPTRWKTTFKNVLEIRDYLWKHHVGKIEVAITPSLLGIYKLKETVEFMKKIGLFVGTTSIMNRIEAPLFCQTRHIPDKMKEEIGDDIKSLSQYVYDDLMQPRNPHYFELGIKYFDALDKSRGTNWRTTFPELACYTN